jgi:hypothetical protein
MSLAEAMVEHRRHLVARAEVARHGGDGGAHGAFPGRAQHGEAVRGGVGGEQVREARRVGAGDPVERRLQALVACQRAARRNVEQVRWNRLDVGCGERLVRLDQGGEVVGHREPLERPLIVRAGSVPGACGGRARTARRRG